MKSLRVIFFFAVFATSFAKAQDYTLTVPMLISDVAKENLAKVPHLNHKQYVASLIEWNPHIKKNEIIPIGTQLYLFRPYPTFLSGSNYAPALFRGFEREQYFVDVDFGLSLFKRTLTQEVQDLDLKLESTQNSPVSIDSTFFIAPAKGQFHYEVNLGYSYLQASNTNTGVEVPTTNEYKASTYLIYHLKNIPSISLKGGFSYQRLVAFDLRKLAQSDQIEQHNYDIGSLNVGVRYDHLLWNKVYHELALSYAQSVYSKSTYSDQDSDAQLWQLQSTFKLEKFRFVMFYENENSTLSGLKTKLTRFGVGMRFIVF